MKIPEKGKTEIYPISDDKFALVELEDSGRFILRISSTFTAIPKNHVQVNDDNPVAYNAFEELREDLLNMADENHKDQFRE
jgi:hypothetical protein